MRVGRADWPGVRSRLLAAIKMRDADEAETGDCSQARIELFTSDGFPSTTLPSAGGAASNTPGGRGEWDEDCRLVIQICHLGPAQNLIN